MNPSTELIAIARHNGGSVDANEKGEDKPFSAIELRSVLDDLWFRAYKVMIVKSEMVIVRLDSWIDCFPCHSHLFAGQQYSKQRRAKMLK